MDLSTVVAAVASFMVPAVALVTYLLSRKHDEEIEETHSLADAITAVTDANVSITGVLSALLTPMKAQIDHLTEVEQAQGQELLEVRQELKMLQQRFTSIIRYVNILRNQIKESGMEPAAIPSDLDLSGFDFD